MGDVCQNCGKVHGPRMNLGIVVTVEERTEMELVRQKLICIQQDFSIRNIPTDAPQGLVDKFMSSLVDKKSELHLAENHWWARAIEKYKLVGEVYLDFVTGDLYIFETK